MEELFIEGKSLQDRSMESNENDRVPGKVIKYWHHPQTAVVWGGVVGGGHVHIWEELDEKHWREVGEGLVHLLTYLLTYRVIGLWRKVSMKCIWLERIWKH